MQMTAAMREKRSNRCDTCMLEMGKYAGVGRRPGLFGGASAVVMSAISTNYIV